MDLGEFRAAEGVLAYRAWRAPGARGVLVQLHGIESHSEWFAPIAGRLQDRGLSTYALDRLGSGRSDGMRGDVASRDVWLRHVGDFVDWVRRVDAPRALHLVGSCWGAKLAVRHALDRPEAIDGLILLSPGLRVRIDLPLRQKLRVARALARNPRRPFPIPIDREELFTRDPAALAYIRRDPLRLHHVTARFLFEMRKVDRAIRRDIARLSVPLLALFGADDEIVDVTAVLDLLRRGQPTALRLGVFPRAAHSLEFGSAERVAHEISDWHAHLAERPTDSRRCA